jgi:hypothetical protein
MYYDFRSKTIVSPAETVDIIKVHDIATLDKLVSQMKNLNITKGLLFEPTKDVRSGTFA